MTTSEQFVQLCLRQKGDRYVWAAEASPLDPDPDQFDCSELCQWAANRLGVALPDGSQNQYNFVRHIPVSQALKTRGALIFEGAPRAVHHVAVSLGDSTTIEGRGARFGVGTWAATGRPFNGAGLIPNLTYVSADEKPPLNQGGGIAIQPGSSSQAVRFLQAMLNVVRMHNGRSRITEDGVYGNATKAAVEEFQKAWESVHAFHHLINLDLGKNIQVADHDTLRALAIAVNLIQHHQH